jgi:hypothetical protein
VEYGGDGIMRAEHRDLLCLVFTCAVLHIPLVALAWNWGRPPSRSRSLGKSLAWCFLLGFPYVMAFGYLHAAWPHGDSYWQSFRLARHGDPPRSLGFRWDWLISDVVIGLVIILAFGSWVGHCVARGPARTGEEPVPTLPDVGPSWSDRQKGQQNTSDVQPSRENLSEEKRCS